MTTKHRAPKRILSILLCLAILLTYVPLTVTAATGGEEYYNRIVDANTMNNWMKYFDISDPEKLNTANAGGVWTDKSVFKDASAFDNKFSMLDTNRNFLVALSALAANKEVVGYATIPTDTVLVLDLSNSMDGYEARLIEAANQAIKTLLDNNKNNRVGVVLYSGHNQNSTSTYAEGVTRLLDIDRYTAGNNGTYLTYSRGNVSVTNGVTAQNGSSLSASKAFQGATYIQAGLWEAMKMFLDMDTVITDNNWQTDDNRMPIMVLMSDGAPTNGTTYYDDVENSRYSSGYNNTTYKSNVGNGQSAGLQPGNVFLTQLTAAYVMSQVDAHYKKTDSNARSLFYTLGFNVGGNEYAESVLNPDGSTLTDSLWSSYLALQANNYLSVRVKGRNGNATDVSVHRNSYVTSKSYVTDYFSATTQIDSLSNAFNSIVEEILLQSRYYPTHLEGGSPDFAGYVEFTDTIGEYMEVKDIKGILLGDKLFDGHMMASQLANNGTGGLGTMENPTELGHEFIRSVKTRLGIAATEEAQALVAQAYNAGQLKYVSDSDWSNFIGWYAKADGTFSGFWNEGTTTAPEDAVYQIKSYAFLGETSGSIKNSDMMYMTVQVRTNIQTGQQVVTWKIPAALVPLVTYLVTLEGNSVDNASNVQVSVENASTISPIRLVFETGLRSDLNELNINRITDEKHVAGGATRQFWTNEFDISAADHEHHITAMSEFTPSKENERFYYTFDSAVHKKTGENTYELVKDNEALNPNGEYYHRRYIFTNESADKKPVFLYEKMSAKSIEAAEWDATFVTKTGETGAYVVKAGKPARELQMYSELKADEDATKSAHMIFYPYLTEHNDTFYVDMNLGNNGLLEVTPAQGIKLSKTVDVYQTGTSESFRFRIAVHNADGTVYTGSANGWVTELDAVPQTEPAQVSFTAAGVYTVDLQRNQTLWLTGLPTGATYTIEEISDNADYKVKSVHVNGVSLGNMALGVIAEHHIDDVDFVNTAVGEGDLVITKQVVDGNGNTVAIANSVKFTVEVTLTDVQGNPVSGSFAATGGTLNVPANGKFTVSLSAGESFVVHGITEQTRYSVVETNMPQGFALNSERSVLSGVIDASSNDQALVVNTYTPVATNGSGISVDVFKEISGNRTNWLPGESYTFQLERIGATEPVGTAVIGSNDADKHHLFSLSGEDYTAPGTYYYRVRELAGSQGGITYDTAERRFRVVVADADMDGDLEIVSVNNEVNTTVSGSYIVSASFNNVYQPTGSASVTVNVIKRIAGHSLSGFQFALYDGVDLANEIVRSTVTNAAGQASFTLNYAANRATMTGEVYTYYMAEINTGNPNIRYDTAVYKVEVTVTDQGDGTITANAQVSKVGDDTWQGNTPEFTNTYVPSESDFVTITGNKEIVGDRVLNAGEFKFTIAADATTPNAPLPADTTVSNGADGSFAFGAIEFKDGDEGQTFSYIISEVSTEPIGGFTYDAAQYKVTVEVVDNGDATLTANVVSIEKILSTGATTETDIVFTNVYDATDAQVQLSGTKLLTGKTLQDQEFSFQLSPVTQGAPMPDNAVVTNNGDGLFQFGAITFNKAGVYVYRLTELTNASNPAGEYDFDESVYLITVTVTDNSRGVLSAEVTMTKNGIDSGEIVFRNGFVPTPVSYDISANFGGEKVLNGRVLEDGEFAFALINAINGQQIGEAVHNDENGNFRFPTVTLSTPGIHHFKIVEVVGDEQGVTYDTTSFHIRLEVEQKNDGALNIKDEQLHKGVVSIQEVEGVLTEVTIHENITGTGEHIKFVNTYETDPAYVVIRGTKTLQGRDLNDQEFSFELYDATGAKLETVSNSADGTITFTAIQVNGAGEYTYTVKEVLGNEKNVIYDESVYTVKVNVTDNLDGTLQVEYTYTKDAEAASQVLFENVYYPAPPKTGDDNPVLIWITVMILCTSGLIATVPMVFKKEEE